MKTFAEDILFLSKVYGWELKYHRAEYAELHFVREKCALTVWYSKLTVRTTLIHPVLGKTQMFRKRVDLKLLEAIFRDPRTHTNRGYRVKSDTNKRRWRKTNTIDLYKLATKKR